MISFGEYRSRFFWKGRESRENITSSVSTGCVAPKTKGTRCVRFKNHEYYSRVIDEYVMTGRIGSRAQCGSHRDGEAQVTMLRI
jgi:hypothetical protein